MNIDEVDGKTRVIAVSSQSFAADEDSRVCPRCQTPNDIKQLLKRDYRCSKCNLEMAHLDYAPNGALRGIFGWLRAPGDIILDRYKVESVLGKGGFGAAYLVDDLQLNGKRRALKEVPALLFDEYETGLLIKLDHPAIPDIIERRVVDGMVYMVLKFGGSRTLGSERKQSPGGRIPQARLLPWMRQLCAVLTYLHSQNPPIIHRDLKPDNILLNEDGLIMLIDFGIAKESMPEAMTRTLGRAMTQGFSPLEQIIGGGTDERSDIYSLGATFYALLTGQIPPAADERLNGKKALIPPSDIVQEVLPGVEAAILKSLSLKMEDRQQTVREFAEALYVDEARTVPEWTQRGTLHYQSAETGILPPHEPLPAEPSPPIHRLSLPALAAGAAMVFAAVVYYAAVHLPVGTGTTTGAGTAGITAATPSAGTTASTGTGTVTAASTGTGTAASTPAPSTDTTPPPKLPPEERLISLIPQLHELPLSLSKAFYRERDPIELTLDLPTAGFLHVFIVEPGGTATLIFPNKLAPNNQVKPGSLKLPDGKPPLVATPPYGKLWFVAILQSQPRNIYRQDSEGAGKKPVFVKWTARQLLDFLQETQAGNETKAGGVETRVCATSGPCQ